MMNCRTNCVIELPRMEPASRGGSNPLPAAIVSDSPRHAGQRRVFYIRSRLCARPGSKVRYPLYPERIMSNAALQTGPLRHFLQFSDFTKSEILYVLERARLI